MVSTVSGAPTFLHYSVQSAEWPFGCCGQSKTILSWKVRCAKSRTLYTCWDSYCQGQASHTCRPILICWIIRLLPDTPFISSHDLYLPFASFRCYFALFCCPDTYSCSVSRGALLPAGLRAAVKPERVVSYRKYFDVYWDRLDPHLRQAGGVSDIMRFDIRRYCR
jgi:hypothetical protein